MLSDKLLVCVALLGGKFLCGVAILAFAGATWTRAPILHVCNVLLDGSGICEKKCHGNQRKITPRNRDSSSFTRILRGIFSFYTNSPPGIKALSNPSPLI